MSRGQSSRLAPSDESRTPLLWNPASIAIPQPPPQRRSDNILRHALVAASIEGVRDAAVPLTGRRHGPDLLRKKSRSTVSSPIFSYSLASRASSTAALSDAPLLPRVNSEPTPSRMVFFQAWIWLGWTPYRLDSAATVPSSRTAANATFALKSTPCFLRTFAIR